MIHPRAFKLDLRHVRMKSAEEGWHPSPQHPQNRKEIEISTRKSAPVAEIKKNRSERIAKEPKP